MSDFFQSYVRLFLRGEGENGATVVPDTGPLRLSVGAVGNAQISTAQKPWGSSSLAFDGSGDYFTVPSSYFVFPGDFTIEAMVRISAVQAYQPLLEGRAVASFSDFGCGLMNVGGVMRPDFVTVGGSSVRLTATSISIPLNTWVHLAFVRYNGTLMAFAGGVKDATTKSYAGTITPASSTIRIGSVVDPLYMNGYVRDLRVTGGIARYTANFTPPSATFDDCDLPAGKIVLRRANADAIFGGRHRIASTVDRLGAAGSYPVRLYHRASGRLVRVTQSDAAGNYAFDAIAYESGGYFAVAHDTNGDPLNAAVADLLTPVPM